MDLGDLYRDIAETSHDGIWVFDLSGRTVYANPGIAHLLGIGVEELDELSVFDPLDDVGKEQFAEHISDLRRGVSNAEDVECQWVRRDGTVRWVLVSETALRGESGDVERVLHRVSDYTERRRVIQDLEASRRELAEAQRIGRIGSWEWTAATNTVRSSEEMLELYGIGDPDLKSSLEDFLGFIHPDDRERVRTVIRDGLAAGDTVEFDTRIVRPDGTVVWLRSRGEVHRDEQGAAVRVTGTDQDISEIKQGEMALQDLLAQNTLLQALASAANEAETFVDVLREAQQLLLSHDDWIRGQAFLPSNETGDGLEPLHVGASDQVRAEDDPEALALDRRVAARVLRTGPVVWEEDARPETPSVGFSVQLHGDVVAVIVLTERLPFLRHAMIESMIEQASVQLGRVAERERAARELAAARDAAEDASRQKSEFLATMSHEIRTPLNGVIGLNDLLLRTTLDAQQERLAGGVKVASRALLSVINDILDFSKIEAGKLELEHVDFEVCTVFDQVASLLAEDARAKGIDLVVSCHPDVPEHLNGDPTKLAQVVTNLGSNAVKFTEEGEVYIRATASPARGGSRLRVEVSDTGVGVADEHREAIFEAFSQADASTTRRYGGTGLGLAITSELVHAFGGEIGVDSVLGEGSTFWFEIALKNPVDTDETTPDPGMMGVLRSRRVLVVDDNAHNRLILAEQAARWDMQPASASGAADGMRMLVRAAQRDEAYELVLLGHAMPDIDGVDLGHQVQTDPRLAGTPMVMLTSATNPDEQRLAEAGIQACHTKPVPARELQRTVARALGWQDEEPVRDTAAPDARPVPARAAPKVLVVEDNQVNQMVALGILETLGFEADTADDGAEAVEAWQDGVYDAVLMDVQMPRMDGYAATRAIREREAAGRRTPVLAMTAAAIAGEREKCLAAGMDDFLTKPVKPDALAAMLRRWVVEQGAGTTTHVAPEESCSAEEVPVEVLDLERLAVLRDLTPGSTAYLDRAIGNFVQNAEGSIDAIRGAVARGDSGELTYTAHRLKGSALNLGLPTVGHLAFELEMLGDEGRTEGAPTMLGDLEAALDQAVTAVVGYQRSYQDGSVPTR